MNNQQILQAFEDLSTALIADASMRLELPLRLARPAVRPLLPLQRDTGRVLPVRHHGSVDIFLEALAMAEPGDVLVIDNAGQLDEGCIGDLIAIEARACGLSGIIVWGAHRDTLQLQQINFPLFSYGGCPAGPRRLDPAPQTLSMPHGLAITRLEMRTACLETWMASCSFPLST